MDSKEGPMPTQDTLNPKEVLNAPSLERPDRLQKFRAELITNAKNMAAALKQLTTIIRHHPDAPTNTFLSDLEPGLRKQPLTPAQQDIIKIGLDIYSERRQAVKAVRAQYPNDAGLFTFLFGSTPKGRVEVIQGPITLYFRCHNSEDYALIHSEAFLKNHNLNQTQVDKAKRSAGVFIENAPLQTLRGSITAEHAQGSPFNYHAREIYEHEEQHAIMSLFTQAVRQYKTKLIISRRPVPPFVREATSFISFVSPLSLKLLRRDLRHASNSKKELLVKHLLQGERKSSGENRTKDEILAYLKSGQNLQTIENLLTTPEEEGGLYDYFNADWRQAITEELVEVTGEELRPLIRQSVEDVFVREYQDVISDSMTAIITLQNHGFSLEEVVNLLINEPLSRWEKVANRLVHQPIAAP